MRSHSRTEVLKVAVTLLIDIIRAQIARRKARRQRGDFSLSPEEYL